jgi:hypothetical protein
MGIRRHRARMACMLSASLLATLPVVVLVNGCGPGQAPLITSTSEQEPVTTSTVNWEEQLDAHKAAAVQLLVQNSQLREFLENDLYELSGDVLITTNQLTADRSAIILSDGRLIIPDGCNLDWYEAVHEYEPTIVDLFAKFHCVSVVLEQPSIHPERVLSVVLDDFRIGDGRYYSEFLSYSRDGAVEMAENVMTNWYYSARAYP